VNDTEPLPLPGPPHSHAGSDLTGRVAVVTGAGTGIGEAISRRLVADGMLLCLMDTSSAELARVAASLPPGTCVVCTGDVTVESDCARAVDAAMTLGGRLDALINNAAVGTDAVTGPPGSVLDSDVSAWTRTLEVNLVGQYLMMRAALPPMIRAGRGSVVNIASTGAIRAFPGASAYCASKGGVVMLTKQAAADYGPNGVRVNALLPGWIQTPSAEVELAALSQTTGRPVEELRREGVAGVPLRRTAAAAEIAGVCRFLVSDDASYVTGCSLVADGGSSVTEAATAGFSGAPVGA
jgi:meso-butanediol dehydrogenase/(S,S)-butanediol dehydrogenase/diacetyl reductase